MFGLRIIEDRCLVNTVEDWSRVRSRSRAERRRRQGHRQNVQYREVAKPDIYRAGDMLIMHPDIARELERKMREQSRVVVGALPLNIGEAINPQYRGGIIAPFVS